MTVENQKKNSKILLIEEVKNSKVYKDILKNLPDAELTDVNLNEKKNNND